MTREDVIDWLESMKQEEHIKADSIVPCDTEIALCMAIEALKQPEIVRCEDCRYWQDKQEQDKFSEENRTTMPCIEMATRCDFYCGFGKLKKKQT